MIYGLKDCNYGFGSFPDTLSYKDCAYGNGNAPGSGFEDEICYGRPINEDNKSGRGSSSGRGFENSTGFGGRRGSYKDSSGRVYIEYE